MRKPIRILATIVILFGMFMLTTSPVLAIAAPDTIQINAVYVYQHCVETDDQLYLVDCVLDYTVNPDENITEAYLVRLMNGAVELRSVAPYAYYNDGYDRGLVAIYFSAGDAPAWEGSYTIRLVGNPTLSWPGSPPSSSVSTFDLWSISTSIGSTQNELAARVLYFADLLEIQWGVDLIETAASGSYLTSYGQDYFINAIPYLSIIAPGVFSGSMSAAEFETRTYTQTYSTSLRTALIGTPLDFTDLADALGIEVMFVSSILYLVVMAILLYYATVKIRSYKPALLLSAPLIVVGALLGMLPLLLAIIMGFFCVMAIAYAFFYQKGYG